MKKIITENKIFYASYFIIFVVFVLLNYLLRDEQFTYQINQHHNTFLDFICRYFTHIGDGFFSVFIILLLFAYNKSFAIAVSISYAISSGIAQGLKHVIFDDSMRPSVVMKNVYLHFVDGVEILHQNSFPSGHTTAAFAAFTLFALFFRSRWLQLLFLLCAVFVAFTRIYLLQHFLSDIIAGSFIGLTTATFTYLYSIENKFTDRIIAWFDFNKSKNGK